MRVLLLFVGVAALIRSQSCPSQYQLIEGRCVRPLFLEQRFVIGEDLPNARTECAKAEAHLPIIKSNEENELFNRIANSFPSIGGSNIWLVLDITCNSITRHLEWIDGTSINYLPAGSDSASFDCVADQRSMLSLVVNDRWFTKPSSDVQTKTVLCVIDSSAATTIIPTTTKGVPTTTMPPVTDQCGDYTLMANPTDSRNPCIKVFAGSMSWENAQRQCSSDFGSLITIHSAEENKFFWRTAISNNILEGMHIGAHLSNESTTQWTWIDGEVPFDGKTYSNFVSFFPVPGAGECSSMATESTAAQWINEDCHKNEQPFICRRNDFSDIPETCPTGPVKAGEDFFPPGFPNSDIPCEYYLIVAAKKLVELEIMTLVADYNKDFLEVLEGTSGPHMIANLTGTIFTTTKFTTTESNVMRVSWKPSGSGSGRGFRIRFNEIDQ